MEKRKEQGICPGLAAFHGSQLPAHRYSKKPKKHVKMFKGLDNKGRFFNYHCS
jgi:hypothetical protein